MPVVQAMAFTKYLGYMNLTFDENGDLTEFEGRPILLDHTMPQGNWLETDAKKEWKLYHYNWFF